MAIGKSSITSASFFKIPKDDGVLLPIRNRSLFAAALVLIAVSTSLPLLLASDDLPRTHQVGFDVVAFNNGVNPGCFPVGIWMPVRAGAAYALETACVVVAVLLVLLFVKHIAGLGLLFEGLMILAAAIVVAFFCLLSLALCCANVAIIVVSELGHRTAGAVRRAWRRLLGGRRRRRGVLSVALIGALAATTVRVHALAKSGAIGSLAAAPLLGLLYAFLTAALEFSLYGCDESNGTAATKRRVFEMASEHLFRA